MDFGYRNSRPVSYARHYRVLSTMRASGRGASCYATEETLTDTGSRNWDTSSRSVPSMGFGNGRASRVDRVNGPTRLIRQSGVVSLAGLIEDPGTSVNITGEPLLDSPVQATRCFYSIGLGVFAIGDCIVEKC